MTVLTAGRRSADDVQLDLLKPDSVIGSAIPDGVDVCVHAAAANEVSCRHDPVAAYTANVTATRALLRAAESAGIRNLVYLSTFHVFGRPCGDLDEDVAPLPENDYGMTHWMAEQAFLMHGRRTDARVSILRPANLFGEPVDWDTFNRWTLAPFDFARQAVKYGVVRLLSDGAPVRSYVSISYLAQAVLAAVSGLLPATTHLAGEVWSMAALAELCARIAREVTAREIGVSFGKADLGELPYRFLSRHWPAEAGGTDCDMSAFIRSVVSSLLETPQ